MSVAVGTETIWTRLAVEVDPVASLELEYSRIVGAHGELRFLHHNIPLHLGYSAVFFLYWGVTLWIIMLLRRILATTGKDRPFEALNARRLDTLGWILAAIWREPCALPKNSL